MSLIPDDRAEGVPRQISDLADTVRGIEGRLLHLVEEAARGGVPLEDFISELAFLARDLRRCFRRVVDMKDRRDLNFKTLQEVEQIESHAIWLYRKLHLEQAFFRKLHSETKLRSMLAAEALAVYQELLDAEELERDFLGKGDADIKRQLLAGDYCVRPEGT